MPGLQTGARPVTLPSSLSLLLSAAQVNPSWQGLRPMPTSSEKTTCALDSASDAGPQSPRCCAPFILRPDPSLGLLQAPVSTPGTTVSPGTWDLVHLSPELLGWTSDEDLLSTRL